MVKLAFLIFRLKMADDIKLKENFKCDVSNCGVSFTIMDNLLTHLSMIHDGVKEKFRCLTCNKSFHKKFHFDVHSNNSNPVACETCSAVCCSHLLSSENSDLGRVERSELSKWEPSGFPT